MTITTTAIETAIRNAAKMHGAYTVSRKSEHFFIVQHNADFNKTYAVDTFPGYEHCQCEQFAKVGICKHIRFVAETLEIEAGEAREEARADAESMAFCN